MVIGALAAAMMGEIKDNGSELRICVKLRNQMGDLVGSPNAREISDEEETLQYREETKGEKEI